MLVGRSLVVVIVAVAVMINHAKYVVVSSVCVSVVARVVGAVEVAGVVEVVGVEGTEFLG